MGDEILLSVGIIFKNEIRCLERCLRSLNLLKKRLPCEIVMADTGSDDGSRDIAERYADEVFDYPWRDDFSAARNAVLDRCRGRWLLTIDCDEWLTDDGLPDNLRELLTGDIFAFDGALVVQRNYEKLDDTLSYQDGNVPRLVRARKAGYSLRYAGKIHEQPVYIKNGREEPLRYTVLPGFILHHDGYADDLPGVKNKYENRNLKLIEGLLEKEPDNLFYLISAANIAPDQDGRFELAERIHRAAARLAGRKESGYDRPMLSSAYWEILRIAAAGLKQDAAEEWTLEWQEFYPESVLLKIDGMAALVTMYSDSTFSSDTGIGPDKVLTYGSRYIDNMTDYRAGRYDPDNPEFMHAHLIYDNDVKDFQVMSRIALAAYWEGRPDLIGRVVDYLITRPLVTSEIGPMLKITGSLQDTGIYDKYAAYLEGQIKTLSGSGSAQLRQVASGCRDRLKDTGLTAGERKAGYRKPDAVNPELMALAEKIRAILAQFPADDPNVMAIKASPAYQQVKELIEE